jgi:RES domain-containing protein
MLSGWRIASPEYSSTAEVMMSGEGAFLYGGRWNSKGVRVVYLGTSLAQAAMELLPHLGRADILKQFKKMEVFFPESTMQHIAIEDLPGDWAQPSMASSVQNVGDAWVADNSSLILQIPSAAVAGEYNYLVNLQHPDFVKIVYSEIMPFSYDPWLLK